jgi:hypothetical protein
MVCKARYVHEGEGAHVMSRGLGRLQCLVLEAFKSLGGHASVVAVAEHIHGEPIAVGSSDYESVRRAVKSLVKRGHVCKLPLPADRVRIRYVNGPSTWHHQYWLPEAVDER